MILRIRRLGHPGDYPRKLNAGIEGACPSYDKASMVAESYLASFFACILLGVLTDGASFGGIFRGAAGDLRLLGFRLRRPRHRARWRGCCFGFARPPHLKCSFRIVDQRMARGLLFAALDFLVEPEEESIGQHVTFGMGAGIIASGTGPLGFGLPRASRASGDPLCPGLCRGGLARACRFWKARRRKVRQAADCGSFRQGSAHPDEELRFRSKIRHGLALSELNSTPDYSSMCEPLSGYVLKLAAERRKPLNVAFPIKIAS